MGKRTIELDVRPYLRKKLEPFKLIMDTVKSLGPEDTFVLHATFKPTPLLGVMKAKGFAYKTEKLAKDHWVVTFVPKEREKELGEMGAAEERLPSLQKAKADPSRDETPDSPRTIELDNRGLEPPQPMMRTLNALEKCRKGDRVVIHNDRVPVFLLEELDSLGYPYEIEELPDGSARVTIQKR